MKNLLVAVDFSASTPAVLEEASKLGEQIGARLNILHVASRETGTMAFDASQFSAYSPEMMTLPNENIQLSRDISAEELKREHAELLTLSSKLRKTGVTTQAMLVRGRPAEIIVGKAHDLNSEMIILGSHGHGLLHKAIMGSVSETVLRHAGVPVLIIPHPDRSKS